HTLDYIGLGATFLPFVISFRSSKSSSITMEVTDAQGHKQQTTSGHTEFSDPVALAGGAVGLVVALATISLWQKTDPSKRALRVGLTLGVLALGAVQLLLRSGILS